MFTHWICNGSESCFVLTEKPRCTDTHLYMTDTIANPLGVCIIWVPVHLIRRINNYLGPIQSQNFSRAQPNTSNNVYEMLGV